MLTIDPARIDMLVADIFEAARAPGGAVAVTLRGETVYTKGFGHHDTDRNQLMGPDILYPIASTTKAINATLIGMLVDDGLLGWDDPVQDHLPSFRLADPVRTPLVTIRDCLAMRTGLPRHDWVWAENYGDRRELVNCFAHLELTAGFRERYQYNNLTVTLIGILAEAVTGKRWEALVQERLLNPIGMDQTVFGRPAGGSVTSSWHERADRTLLASRHGAAAVITAPSGGSIHSTVADMARWMAFNLSGGKTADRQLIKPDTLAEIHAPQMVVGKDPTATSPTASYGLGWSIDHHNGHLRITHGGYLDDVASDVALFPEQQLGIVCFSNFGPSPAVKAITAETFDLVMGLTSKTSHADRLADYEKRIVETRARAVGAGRVPGTQPSHDRSAFAGHYCHPGYGTITVSDDRTTLLLRIGQLEVALEHWHYDSWVAAPSDDFAIHVPHCFDGLSQFQFLTDSDGTIAAVTIPLEPTASAIRFERAAHSAETLAAAETSHV